MNKFPKPTAPSTATLPEELTAAYREEVRLLTLDVLDELAILYSMDDEQIERYCRRIDRYLAVLGVPELYRENPLVIDERIFAQICSLIERHHLPCL